MHHSGQHNVPHLKTALQGPLHALESQFLNNSFLIEKWFRKQWPLTPPPLTCSVDLRNAGFKLAAIDTNVFPAGFNHLNPDFFPLCVQAVQATLESRYPCCDGLLLVGESHTRNELYFESLNQLKDIFLQAGYDTRVASLREDLLEPQEITLPNGKSFTLYPIQRQGDRVQVEGFTPCLLLLNNDLSNGTPSILENLSQPIEPPLSLGWGVRTKTHHFYHYEKVVEEFSQVLNLDPWFLNPFFCKESQLDFMAKEGLETLAEKAEALLKKIKEKYQQYDIKEAPFLIIKANAGTYGMAVMRVKSGEDILHMNRKQRTHMSTAKGHRTVHEVILQEGVYTFETLGTEEAVAEPVVYMIGHHVVGGFYRVHQHRGNDENLNSPGMHFEPLAFEEPCHLPQDAKKSHPCQNRFYAYGVVARLALLAAAREIHGVTE